MQSIKEQSHYFSLMYGILHKNQCFMTQVLTIASCVRLIFRDNCLNRACDDSYRTSIRRASTEKLLKVPLHVQNSQCGFFSPNVESVDQHLEQFFHFSKEIQNEKKTKKQCTWVPAHMGGIQFTMCTTLLTVWPPLKVLHQVKKPPPSVLVTSSTSAADSGRF